jgi:AcrR family transcriptional regulator
MPSNRRDIPRDDRINAILDVATRLFLERGFNETTVADIARQVGVRSGAVYWYFPSKDHVLAAVMERATARELERLDRLPPDVSGRDRLVRYLTDLRPFRDMHNSVRERVRSSEVVREAQRVIGQRTRTLIQKVFDEQPTWCDPEMAAEVIMAAFEGTNVELEPRMYGTDMVRFLLDRVFLVPSPGAAPQPDQNGSEKRTRKRVSGS